MCNCIDRVNSQLKKKGAAMDVPFAPQRVKIFVRPLSLIGKLFLPTVFATYCPFCGKAYAGTVPAAKESHVGKTL